MDDRTLLEHIHETLVEINPNNYSNNDVCEQNNSVITVLDLISKHLGYGVSAAIAEQGEKE